MVSTTTLRPRSAARSASAADVVVLPTPPAPQHTMIWVVRSSSSASTSSTGGVIVIRGPCGVVRGSGAGEENVVGWSSCHSLVAQQLGQLDERPLVDPAREARQLVGGHALGSDELALLVLEVTSYGVVARLGDERPHQAGVDVDPGAGQLGGHSGRVDGVLAHLRQRARTEVLRSHQVDHDTTYRQ